MRRSKDLLVEETAPALLREHWIRKNAAINSGLVVQLFEILKNGKKNETNRKSKKDICANSDAKEIDALQIEMIHDLKIGNQ